MGNSRTKGAHFTVMLVVIVAHLLFLMLFDFSMRSIRKIDRMPVTLLTFIKEQREKPHLDIRMNSNFTSTDHAITVPNVTLDISTAPGLGSFVPRIVDWKAEANAVAKEAAKKLTSTHFKSLDKQDPCSESDPLNKLKKECQSQTNHIDWNSELSPAGLGFGKHPHADGTLFDHLKPEYLKKPVEDICSKTMVGCNHSSSSSAR